VSFPPVAESLVAVPFEYGKAIADLSSEIIGWLMQSLRTASDEPR